ncbi:MAG: MBL fold metallo-hydrolase [Desulfobacterales bacterium]|nr:MBL fold metallo-hydrolase [Desulfobacterales bacterium]
MIRVTWTGAAGLRFETDKEVILIDPYYTRVGIFDTLFKRIAPDPAAIAAALPAPEKVAAIVVGHTHSDHALDVPWIAARSACKVVGSHSLETLMSLGGLPGRTRVCAGGETVSLTESARVTMIRSAHGLVTLGKGVPFDGEIRATSTLPMKASGYRVGTVFAPLLDLDGRRFLHVGSANFDEAHLRGQSCDVLFLCVPGWKRREGYPRRLIEMTRPSTVVLFHYDNFSKPHVPGTETRRMPLMDMPGMIRAIQGLRPAVELRVPDIGEAMAF